METEVVEISGVAAGGDGLARLADGRVIFCEGALPGERVRVVVVDRRKDFVRGRVEEVLAPSVGRVAPPCPHVARGCGGCTWQHVAPGAAPALKVSIVEDALRRIARRPDLAVRTGGATALDGYRTTVRLAVDGEGRPAYRVRHGQGAVAVDSCLVAHPLLEELIVGARFPGASEVTLRVGVAGGERLAVPDRRVRAVVPADTVVVDPRGRGRPPAVNEDVAGRRWRVSADSFFQAGPGPAQLLADAVAAAAGEVPLGARVVDLYAGVGLLGGVVAARGPAGSPVELVAVESHPAAARDASVNLADLRARVVLGDVADAAAELGGGGDLTIADPARPGLARPGVGAVAAIGSPSLVLVSCDPASFGRDVALLDAAGYTAEDVLVLDLFPGTFHVEVVSRFGLR